MKINYLTKSEELGSDKLGNLLGDQEVYSDFNNIGSEDFLIVDISLLEELKDYFELFKKKAKNLVFVSTSNDYNIKYAFNILSRSAPPYHIVGLNSEECLTKVAELVNSIFKNKPMGLSDMIGVYKDNVEVKIQDSSKISETIRETLGQIEFDNCFSQIKDNLSQLINELLYNALFNAPTDDAGEQQFLEQDRKDHVSLDAAKAATLKIFNSEERIFTSVVDHYGSITKEVIDAHISKNEVSDKAGGAGIGLSLIYNNSHELIFVVEPGVQTEVISVINKYKRFKQNMQHVRSFHFFIKE
ncbi:MAG: hypothetical protein EP319_01770 [Deltaproteobacteria bacterium]|nr:MAG: hypothetical protein EP319_01770 [Deltaproteobacteria bacterium]